MAKKKVKTPPPEFPGKSEIVPPVENEFGECCYVLCQIPSTTEWAGFRRSGSPQGPKYERLTPRCADRTAAALALSEHMVTHGK